MVVAKYVWFYTFSTNTNLSFKLNGHNVMGKFKLNWLYTLSLVRFLYMHRTIKLSILYPPHDVDINLWRFVQLDVVKYERFKKKVLLLKIKTICIGVWESGPWWVFSHFQCIPACRWNKFKLLLLMRSYAKYSQVTLWSPQRVEDCVCGCFQISRHIGSHTPTSGENLNVWHENDLALSSFQPLSLWKDQHRPFSQTGTFSHTIHWYMKDDSWFSL